MVKNASKKPKAQAHKTDSWTLKRVEDFNTQLNKIRDPRKRRAFLDSFHSNLKNEGYQDKETLIAAAKLEKEYGFKTHARKLITTYYKTQIEEINSRNYEERFPTIRRSLEEVLSNFEEEKEEILERIRKERVPSSKINFLRMRKKDLETPQTRKYQWINALYGSTELGLALDGRKKSNREGKKEERYTNKDIVINSLKSVLNGDVCRKYSDRFELAKEVVQRVNLEIEEKRRKGHIKNAQELSETLAYTINGSLLDLRKEAREKYHDKIEELELEASRNLSSESLEKYESNLKSGKAFDSKSRRSQKLKAKKKFSEIEAHLVRIRKTKKTEEKSLPLEQEVLETYIPNNPEKNPIEDTPYTEPEINNSLIHQNYKKSSLYQHFWKRAKIGASLALTGLGILALTGLGILSCRDNTEKVKTKGNSNNNPTKIEQKSIRLESTSIFQDAKTTIQTNPDTTAKLREYNSLRNEVQIDNSIISQRLDSDQILTPSVPQGTNPLENYTLIKLPNGIEYNAKGFSDSKGKRNLDQVRKILRFVQANGLCEKISSEDIIDASDLKAEKEGRIIVSSEYASPDREKRKISPPGLIIYNNKTEINWTALVTEERFLLLSELISVDLIDKTVKRLNEGEDLESLTRVCNAVTKASALDLGIRFSLTRGLELDKELEIKRLRGEAEKGGYLNEFEAAIGVIKTKGYHALLRMYEEGEPLIKSNLVNQTIPQERDNLRLVYERPSLEKEFDEEHNPAKCFNKKTETYFSEPKEKSYITDSKSEEIKKINNNKSSQLPPGMNIRQAYFAGYDVSPEYLNRRTIGEVKIVVENPIKTIQK